MAAGSARTILLVRTLQLEVSHRMAEALAPFRLTPTQYMVLSLASDHASLSTAEMARRFQIAPQSMNQTIAALLRKRLIGREESPAHRRILRIRLTPAGRKLLGRCDAVMDEVEQIAFESLGSAELKALRALLRKALFHPGKPAPPG
jgi:DNA-binding MarR family transcriptional regulator